MKQQKNKVVFVLVMVSAVLFIIVYGILTFGKDKKEALRPDRIPMPDLETDQKGYESKLEAVEAVREERENIPPKLYPDHMVDEKGFFNPDYMEYEKQRIIDSLQSTRNQPPVLEPMDVQEENPLQTQRDSEKGEGDVNLLSANLTPKGLAGEHQLFFASDPKMGRAAVEEAVRVRVDGDQVVQDGHRLVLRLEMDAYFNGRIVPRNKRVYGFVKIRPNRVMVELARLGNDLMALKAFDLQDGHEGIYIKNRLRDKLRTTAVDGALGEVNIPGMPQVSRLKGIFQRDNNTLKVHIKDNYQMLLKP